MIDRIPASALIEASDRSCGWSWGKMTWSEGKLSYLFLHVSKVVFLLSGWLVVEAASTDQGLGNDTEIIMVFAL